MADELIVPTYTANGETGTMMHNLVAADNRVVYTGAGKAGTKIFLDARYNNPLGAQVTLTGAGGTISGYDVEGAPLVETLAAAGGSTKVFTTILSVTPATTVTTFTVAFGPKFGCPKATLAVPFSIRNGVRSTTAVTFAAPFLTVVSASPSITARLELAGNNGV